MKEFQSNKDNFKEIRMIEHIHQNYKNGNLYILLFFNIQTRRLSGKKHINYDPNLISNKKVFYWERTIDKNLKINSEFSLENQKNNKNIKGFPTCNNGNILEWNMYPLINEENEKKKKRDPNFSLDPKIIL